MSSLCKGSLASHSLSHSPSHDSPPPRPGERPLHLRGPQGARQRVGQGRPRLHVPAEERAARRRHRRPPLAGGRQQPAGAVAGAVAEHVPRECDVREAEGLCFLPSVAAKSDSGWCCLQRPGCSCSMYLTSLSRRVLYVGMCVGHVCFTVNMRGGVRWKT